MWFTSYIRHHLNCICTLKRIYKKCPAARNLSRLESCELELQYKFIAAKTNFESDLIQYTSHCNISRIYKYIDNITGYSSIPSIIFLDSFEAVTNYEKANLFNSYFHSVFTKSSIHLPDNGLLSLPSSYLSDIFIDDSDVFSTLHSLNPTKSMGIDNIGPRILKCSLSSCSLSATSPSVYVLFFTALHSQ